MGFNVKGRRDGGKSGEKGEYREDQAAKAPRRKARGSAGTRDLRHPRELGGLALALAGCFLALLLYLGWSGGIVGSATDEALRYLFGILAFLAPPACILAGIYLIFSRSAQRATRLSGRHRAAAGGAVSRLRRQHPVCSGPRTSPWRILPE